MINLSDSIQEGNFRKGLMGHTTRLGNLLLKHYSKESYTLERGWSDFTKLYLSSQNEIESRALGGRSRIMSFDLTDHFMDASSEKNSSDMFENMDYDCDKNNPIQEEDEKEEEENVNEFMTNCYWKIEIAQALEELD